MKTLDPYLLGTSSAELEHLVAQAETYAPEAQQLLELVGLGRGDAAIDLGCGALGILDLLAERVGPNGRVVGLDREPRMLSLAAQLTERRRVEVELVKADAADTGLQADSFDFVHARTLLLNVDKPKEVIAEMVALARPGAVVAVQEPDSAGWVCDPPHPAWEVLRSALTAAYRRSGKDFDIGRRAARLLREAGLEDVQVRPTARATQTGDYYQTFLLTLVELLRNEILALGTIDESELDAHVESLEAHVLSPGTITCQPNIWQAWGRNPR
jgi:ubiquinone/menaquinone biosynthesis C-methylase UbiE